MPDSLAVICERNGGIGGFGVLRQCRQGFKIGPLFADSPEIAEALFASLADFAEGGFVILDLPETNALALALAHRHGMEPLFETARMYCGPKPSLPLERIYGITSFELG